MLHLITAQQESLQNEVKLLLEKSTPHDHNTKLASNIISNTENIMSNNLITHALRNNHLLKGIDLNEINARDNYKNWIKQETVDIRNVSLKETAKALHEIKTKEIKEIQQEMSIQRHRSKNMGMEM
jgi:hypothetical protein